MENICALIRTHPEVVLPISLKLPVNLLSRQTGVYTLLKVDSFNTTPAHVISFGFT